jgi:hypothetical protein
LLCDFRHSSRRLVTLIIPETYVVMSKVDQGDRKGMPRLYC